MFLQLAHLVMLIQHLAEGFVGHILEMILDPALGLTLVSVELSTQQIVVQLAMPIRRQQGNLS